MNTPAPIEIFKSGKHKAMNGAVLEFSESDLEASAAAYDPKLHEAPLVIGHPKLDAPRWGGVGSLSFADGLLNAAPVEVVPEFAELVNKKMYNKVSASFYTPTHPANPVPGVYYLRHVGFLGATPPSIKGLNQAGISFSDAEDGIVEFGDWDDRTVARIFRGVRNWMIGKFGTDEADKAISEWDVQSLADSAAQPEELDQQISRVPNFSEKPTPKGDEMSAEDKARLSALEEENARLKAREAEFAEAEKKRQADTAHAGHVSFADGLIKNGRLVPGNKDVMVAALDVIAAQESPLEFGEGDAKVALTVDSFQKALQASPVIVNFGEHGGDQGASAAEGLSNDEVSQRAREYKSKRDAAGDNISFAEAVDAVHQGLDQE